MAKKRDYMVHFTVVEHWKSDPSRVTTRKLWRKIENATSPKDAIMRAKRGPLGTYLNNSAAIFIIDEMFITKVTWVEKKCPTCGVEVKKTYVPKGTDAEVRTD